MSKQAAADVSGGACEQHGRVFASARLPDVDGHALNVVQVEKVRLTPVATERRLLRHIRNDACTLAVGRKSADGRPA
jgi:hypothetical protein